MSRSYGGLKSPFVGLISGLIVVLAVGAIAFSFYLKSQISSRREAVPETAERYCRIANTKDCAELIPDISSANSAEDAVDLAFWQAVLNILGVAGLGFTVIYARAAWKAAEGTHKSLLENERRELRAYIHVDSAELVWTNQDRPHFFFRCMNTGQTPATYFEIGVKCDLVEIGSTAYREIPDRLEYTSWSALGGGQALTTAVAADKECTVSPSELLRHKNGRLSVRGRVRYADIFGDHYESEFTFFRKSEDMGRRDAEGKLIRKMSAAPAKLRVYQKLDEQGR